MTYYKNIVKYETNVEVRKQKLLYFAKKLNKAEPDPKKQWNVFNTLLNYNKAKTIVIETEEKGEIKSDDYKISN